VQDFGNFSASHIGVRGARPKLPYRVWQFALLSARQDLCQHSFLK